MKVRIIDEDGTAGVIDNDLEPAEAVSEEVRRFVDRTKHARDGPVTLDSLGPSFLVDLYVRTSIRRVEPVASAGEPARGGTGIPWNRVRVRYSPPTGTARADDGEEPATGGVSRGDDPTPDASTRSPTPNGNK